MSPEKDKRKNVFASTGLRIIAGLIDVSIIGVLVYLAYITGGGIMPLFLVPFGYYFLSEAIWDRTLGKYIFGLVVIDSSREQYDETRMMINILIRSLCRFIPFDFISFLFNDNGQVWHDQFSNTTVIVRKTMSESYFV